MKPAPPVMNCFTLWSLQVDRAVIAEHQARRTRALLRTSDIHVPPDEGVGEPRNSHDATVLEHDRMLDLGVDDLAVAGNPGERADVVIDVCRAAAVNGPIFVSTIRVRAPMIAGPRTCEPMICAPSSITTRPSICDASSTL